MRLINHKPMLLPIVKTNMWIRLRDGQALAAYIVYGCYAIFNGISNLMKNNLPWINKKTYVDWQK
jgi:hypothetical protein